MCVSAGAHQTTLNVENPCEMHAYAVFVRSGAVQAAAGALHGRGSRAGAPEGVVDPGAKLKLSSQNVVQWSPFCQTPNTRRDTHPASRRVHAAPLAVREAQMWTNSCCGSRVWSHRQCVGSPCLCQLTLLFRFTSAPAASSTSHTRVWPPRAPNIRAVQLFCGEDRGQRRWRRRRGVGVSARVGAGERGE